MSLQHIFIKFLFQETFYRPEPGPGIPDDPVLILSFSLLNSRVPKVEEVRAFKKVISVCRIIKGTAP